MTKPLKPIRLADLSKAELIEVIRVAVRELRAPEYVVKDAVLKRLESRWRATQQSAVAAHARCDLAFDSYQKKAGHRGMSAYAAALADCERLDAATEAAFKQMMAAYDREVEL